MKFKTLAREWLDEVHTKQVKDSTSLNVGGEVSRHLFKRIGDLDIIEITPKILLDILLEISTHSPHLAKRLCQRLNAIFVYAGIMGYIDSNPAYRLSAFLPKNKVRHHNHISDAAQLSQLLKDVDKERGISPATKSAFWVLVYTSTRRSETCLALRSEFDLPNRIWHIPADRTKTGNAHTVTLSEQVITVLSKEFARVPQSPWAFTSPHTKADFKHIDPWSPYYLLVKLGYQGKQTLHGFRHIFSTHMHNLEKNSDAIELSLGHVIPGVKGVYNHAQMFDQRFDIMQEWADYIDNLRDIL